MTSQFFFLLEEENSNPLNSSDSFSLELSLPSPVVTLHLLTFALNQSKEISTLPLTPTKNNNKNTTKESEDEVAEVNENDEEIKEAEESISSNTNSKKYNNLPSKQHIYIERYEI